MRKPGLATQKHRFHDGTEQDLQGVVESRNSIRWRNIKNRKHLRLALISTLCRWSPRGRGYMSRGCVNEGRGDRRLCLVLCVQLQPINPLVHQQKMHFRSYSVTSHARGNNSSFLMLCNRKDGAEWHNASEQRVSEAASFAANVSQRPAEHYT